MVLKQLGIVLEGYQSGSTLHFRGTVFSHYITEWKGKCRFAFDHTTKDSVRREVQADIAQENQARESLQNADEPEGGSNIDDEHPVAMQSMLRTVKPVTSKRKRATSPGPEEREADHDPVPNMTAKPTKLKLFCKPPPKDDPKAGESDSSVDYQRTEPTSHPP